MLLSLSLLHLTPPLSPSLYSSGICLRDHTGPSWQPGEAHQPSPHYSPHPFSLPQASASETTPGRRGSRVKRTTPVRTSKASAPAATAAAAAAPFPPEGGCPPAGQQRPSRTAAAASGTTGRYIPDPQAEAQAVASLHKEAGNTSFQAAKYEQVWTGKEGEVKGSKSVRRKCVGGCGFPARLWRT